MGRCRPGPRGEEGDDYRFGSAVAIHTSPSHSSRIVLRSALNTDMGDQLKLHSKSRRTLVPLLVAVLVLTFALALGAAEARASEGGMAGMPGMTEEEMQAMGQPEAAPPQASTDGHGSETVMDPHMSMGGGSVNWFVIGGFIVLVVGSTFGAMATKRHLARRMAAGELASAGALDV